MVFKFLFPPWTVYSTSSMNSISRSSMTLPLTLVCRWRPSLWCLRCFWALSCGRQYWCPSPLPWSWSTCSESCGCGISASTRSHWSTLSWWVKGIVFHGIENQDCWSLWPTYNIHYWSTLLAVLANIIYHNRFLCSVVAYRWSSAVILWGLSLSVPGARGSIGQRRRWHTWAALWVMFAAAVWMWHAQTYSYEHEAT